MYSFLYQTNQRRTKTMNEKVENALELIKSETCVNALQLLKIFKEFDFVKIAKLIKSLEISKLDDILNSLENLTDEEKSILCEQL